MASSDPPARRRLIQACGLVFGLALVNFTAFWIGAWLVGGDAWSGRVEGGRYYLGSHGRLVEVSAAIYRYSQIHILSLIVTQPVGIAAAILAGYLERGKTVGR